MFPLMASPPTAHTYLFPAIHWHPEHYLVLPGMKVYVIHSPPSHVTALELADWQLRRPMLSRGLEEILQLCVSSMWKHTKNESFYCMWSKRADGE